MKKIISFIMCLIMSICSFQMTAFANVEVMNYDYAQSLKGKGFPQSYIDYLVPLHDKYPNWEFVPFNTELDWQEAVNGERTPHNKQLIQKTSYITDRYLCNCPNCFINGSHIPQEGSSWFSASEQAVAYYMDPRASLDEKYIWQFKSTAYSDFESENGVESIISKTWMANSIITYKDAKGNDNIFYNDNGQTVRYSQAIIEAAKKSGLSAYYIASKIVQEVGGKTNSAGGASGTYPGFEGIYNYYNIGANSGVRDGLVWASQSEGVKTNCDARMRENATVSSTHIITAPVNTSVNIIEEVNGVDGGKTWYHCTAIINGVSYTGYIRSDLVDTQNKYNRPWTNPYKSIINGAMKISEGFSKHQNTGYLQKFNVNKASGHLHSHEYMANIRAASTEALSVYQANLNAGTLSSPNVFHIPVFYNMPSETCNMDVDMQAGYWKNDNGAWHFYRGRTMVTNSWVKDHSDQYVYVNQSGDIVRDGWYLDDYSWFIVDKDGHKIVNQWIKDDSGQDVLLDEFGYIVRNDWRKDETDWYYLDANGHRLVNGWAKDFSGQRVFLDEHGYISRERWQFDSVGWFYVDKDGHAITNSWVDDFSKQKVYVDASGYIVRNDWHNDNNEWIYLDQDGHKLTNAWTKDHSGQNVYVDASGRILRNAWGKDDVGLFYVDQYGHRQTNRWISYNNGQYLYLDDTGYAVFNRWLKDDKDWYYIDKNGNKVTNDWATDNNGKRVLVNADGYIIRNSWQRDKKDWFYLDIDGHKVVNTWVKDLNSMDVFLDENGYITRNEWKCDSDWFYLDKDGHRTINSWVKDFSEQYVYVNQLGYITRDIWIKDDIDWFYLDINGHKIVNAWVKDNNNQDVLVDGNGHILRNGWHCDDKDWLYLDRDGHKILNTWVKDHSQSDVYLNSDGYISRETWVNDGVDWIYLDKYGHKTINKWAKDYSGQNVYLNSLGYISRNTWKEIDGKRIYFDENGHIVPNN